MDTCKEVQRERWSEGEMERGSERVGFSLVQESETHMSRVSLVCSIAG